MRRYTVISADCHAGAPYSEGGFLEYVEPKYRSRLEQQMEEIERANRERMASLFAMEFMAEQDSTDAAQAGGRSGAWDAERRITELERDGIVADVIFPDGSQSNDAPFLAAHGPGAIGADHALQAVGAWAYNAWLAEFCAKHPGRHAGLAVITIHDVEEAVAQIRWGKENGLRGVLLPAGVGDLPFYHDPRYEPIWATCEDLVLPIHTHVGSATPDYGDLPGSGALFAVECLWFSHRPLWFLIWGGVFEAHPGLQMVFAEQGAEWVPDTLRIMDNMYYGMFRHERKRLSLSPKKYFARQCHVEAMFLGRREVEMRHEIGVENMLWGSDYPHYEGTWPHSRKSIAETLAGVPDDEIRKILSENAAALYGFDLDELGVIAAEVGPEVEPVSG